MILSILFPMFPFLKLGIHSEFYIDFIKNTIGQWRHLWPEEISIYNEFVHLAASPVRKPAARTQRGGTRTQCPPRHSWNKVPIMSPIVSKDSSGPFLVEISSNGRLLVVLLYPSK